MEIDTAQECDAAIAIVCNVINEKLADIIGINLETAIVDHFEQELEGESGELMMLHELAEAVDDRCLELGCGLPVADCFERLFNNLIALCRHQKMK
jgi:hypothetical protein